MSKKHALAVALVGLTALGAGCSPESPVSLDKYKSDTVATDATPPGQQASPPAPSESQPPQEVQTPDLPPQASPTATAAIDAHKPTSTPAMPDNKPLAFPGILPAAETQGKFVHLVTTKGDIWFEVLPKEGPRAASNFVYLANRKFYDGLTFHRVVPGFVIQGGDPSGNGTGGPGYQFEDDKVNLPYNEGIVAMANAGPNTNGSQFFIMLADNPLPPNYSIFGRVVKGMDVVKKIAVGDVMTTVTVEATKPK